MASAFGWLDANSEHRKTMLEVIDLFRDEGTTDDLGVGSLRDALSDALFPGTSVLHTRLRYVLFIPWLMKIAAEKSTSPDMIREFRELEFRLIESLLDGGEQIGVIGFRARRDLKQLPSASYWSALRSWGIRESETAEAFFRHVHDRRALERRTARPDDADAFERQSGAGTGLDSAMPGPPDDLLRSTTFALKLTDGPDDEEEYLSRKIENSCVGTALAWLVRHRPGNSPEYVWELDNLAAAPDHVRLTVDHARRFSISIHGAALLYNLMLARKAQREELVDDYSGRLELWRAQLRETAVLEAWSRSDWWATITSVNPNVRRPTRIFVDAWFDLIRHDDQVATSRDAMGLISTREGTIKGGRARLRNQAALDRWSGASGTGRHAFRWRIARSHLDDLYSARDRREAGE